MEYLFTPRVHYHEYSLRGTFCISKVPETYKILWPFPKDIITDHNQHCSQKAAKIGYSMQELVAKVNDAVAIGY